MKRVKVTPLVGSATHGAVCSLLEIDEYRILLDCGYNGLQNVNSLDFFSKIGHVDLVLLSHGDIHHMGALPLIFGQHPVPVLCTLPVFKFGRLMLYDLFLNTEMEGNEKLTSKMFTLDEVDNSLQYVATVKYNQSIQFPFGDVSDLQPIHFCAYPSGRTIGGATWLIRYGAIEVLYAMDINLKKDNVIDAIRLNLLPASPSLLILEGGAESRVMGEEALARNKGRAKDRQLVDIIMETLRQDGNVLIPCETGGRTLELLYLLDKHWEDHKVGLYNLVLFSPMATHAIDYARSQLEWMKDSLSKSFYNEKPNPFELPKVKIITNMKEFKLLPAGPKVVLCTDANFSCGVSKSLLLQWAENPLNRVMFSDYPDQGSLASTLLSQSFSPPVISQVTYPERVLISGDELQRHLDKQNKLEKDREEELQRERLQEELMELAKAKQSAGANDEDDAEELESFDSLSRGLEGKRGLEQVGKMAKFARPWFPMFETRRPQRSISEYGIGLEDLDFTVTDGVFNAHVLKPQPTTAAFASKAEDIALKERLRAEEKKAMKVPIPTKLVSRSTRMEFFCEFKVAASLNGRADKKGIKNLLNQVAPKRVLILRAGQSDEKLVKEMRDLGKECLYYLPKVEQSVFFDERSDRIKLMIPQSLLPSTVKLVRGADDLNCSVFTLAGSAAPLKYSVLDGVRLLRFMGKVEAPTAQVPQVYRDLKSIATADDDVAGVEESLVPATDEQEGDIEIGVLEEDPTEVSLLQELAAADNDTSAPSLQFEDIGLGAVSVGEVQLKALKGALEARGVPVEFRLGLGLVCGAQVIIRKDNENDFILEGPPSTTFFEARKILYEQFALI